MTTPPSSIEERMARLEGSYEQIDRRLGTLEQDVRGLRVDLNAWVDRVDSRFGQIESQIELVNTRIDRVESRIDRLLYWQLGLMGAIAASILTTILTRLL
jgi:hypothetical protein